MITIDTNVLIGLTGNDALMNEFPFLAEMRRAAPSGGGCCGRPAPQRGNPNAVKMQLAYLPLAAQVRFKELTGWDKVRVVFESGSGTQTVIF